MFRPSAISRFKEMTIKSPGEIFDLDFEQIRFIAEKARSTFEVDVEIVFLTFCRFSRFSAPFLEMGSPRDTSRFARSTSDFSRDGLIVRHSNAPEDGAISPC